MSHGFENEPKVNEVGLFRGYRNAPGKKVISDQAQESAEFLWKKYLLFLLTLAVGAGQWLLMTHE